MIKDKKSEETLENCISNYKKYCASSSNNTVSSSSGRRSSTGTIVHHYRQEIDYNKIHVILNQQFEKITKLFDNLEKRLDKIEDDVQCIKILEERKQKEKELESESKAINYSSIANWFN